MITRHVQAISLSLVLLLFSGHFVAASAGQSQRSTSTTKPQSAANPLVNEMITLDGVMREMVSAIAEANGARVVKAIDAIRGPMERTRQAIRAGNISLPKSGSRLDEFLRNYDAFHAQLEALARAGNQNNVEAMLVMTKQLLEGCVNCHRTYRK